MKNGIRFFFLALTLFGLTTPPAPAQIPTGNLKLWLRADAGVSFDGSGTNVTQWADQSSSGNNFSPEASYQRPSWAASAIGGMPALRFDPSISAHLASSATINLTSGLSVFVVARREPGDIYNGFFRIGTSSYLGGPDLQFDFTTGGVTDSGTIRYVANNSLYPAASYSELYGYNAGPAMGKPLLYDVRAASGGIISQRVNGKNENDAPAYGTTYLPTVANYAYVGVGQQGYYWHGEIAEVVVYDTALSGTDRATVYEYLAAKYSIPEPSTALLLLGGAALMLYRFRRVS